MREAPSPAPRCKLRTLLLVLDEFPLFGRLKFFETAIGAMAGYGIKAYLVCQSPNHIIRAYGRDNVIVDNCHVVTAFAAADNESAKRISEMAGEVWEVRPQESEHRPRALLGPHKGATTYREERRPLMLPGEVRQLPRDEQLIFVSGAKPIRCKKLKFDREPIFAKRMAPASRTRVRLTTSHDWETVAPLGRLAKDGAKDKNGAARASRAQADLFEAPPSMSAQALAGLRPSPPAAPAPTSAQSETNDAPSRRLGV